jgi:hypothetical protein
MESNGSKETLFSKALKETKKPGFLKALMVFFICSVGGLVIGFIYDAVQLAAILGIGLGLIWMGVAYFNQKE